MTIRHLFFMAWLLEFLALTLATPLAFAQRDSIPQGYPQSLQVEREILTKQLVSDPQNLKLWKRLAEVYMNIGDDLLEKEDEKIVAYGKAATAAQQALDIDEGDAEAHFLYAANIGNAAKLQGLTVGAMKLPDIIKHVDWAIKLDPQHAPSLQLKGGLLAELPWYLGGNEQLAQDYLEQAIAIDGNFTNARIILAKLLLKDGYPDKARTQLQNVIQADRPHYPFTWARKFRPEAQRLLNTISPP